MTPISLRQMVYRASLNAYFRNYTLSSFTSTSSKVRFSFRGVFRRASCISGFMRPSTLPAWFEVHDKYSHQERSRSQKRKDQHHTLDDAVSVTESFKEQGAVFTDQNIFPGTVQK